MFFPPEFFQLITEEKSLSVPSYNPFFCIKALGVFIFHQFFGCGPGCSCGCTLMSVVWDTHHHPSLVGPMEGSREVLVNLAFL